MPKKATYYTFGLSIPAVEKATITRFKQLINKIKKGSHLFEAGGVSATLDIRLWIMLAFSAMALALSIQTQAAPAAPQLVILNWSDYLDPELIQQFERRHQVQVIEVFYESDEQRTEMLLNNDAQGYDLILTSGIDIALYAKRGWIAPLPTAAIPNRQHLNPRWLNAFEGSTDYALPYSWGTTGILYRSDLLTQPLTQWRQLLDPSAELAGKISLTNDTQELIRLGLKALGYSLNSHDPQQLAEVKQLLQRAAPKIGSFQYPSVSNDSALLDGSIVAAFVYNGDGLMLQEQHDKLSYVPPDEGSILWVDYFALGAKGANPELAVAFLDYINQPEVAAQQAQYIYYATPNQAAEQLLPEAFLNNSAIYPSDTVLERSEQYQSLPPRVLRRWNAIGAEILPKATEH